MLFSAHIPNCDISLQLFTELVNKFYWIEYEIFYLTYHSINFWIHHSRPRHHLHLAPYTKHPLNFCSYRPPILLPLRNPIQHPISMTNDYYSSWSNCLLYMPFRSRPPYLFIYLFIYMLYSMWLSPHIIVSCGSLVRLCSIVYVMQFGNYQLYSPIIYCRGFCAGYIIYTSTIVGICKSSSSKKYISIVLPFDICRYS